MINKKKFIVAVDIGGTKINIGYFNNNTLIKVTRLPTKKYGPDNIDTISQILINSKINISAICLSLTGLVNNEGLWNPINKVTLGEFKKFSSNKNPKKYFPNSCLCTWGYSGSCFR
ncbi:hypothetical protein OAL95_00790 [Alphaproteobacteria bacterium]|nr:hypothetical protein [Alphaproteobacteria bacterium]